MFPLDDICEIFGTTHRTEEYYEQPNRGHLPKFAMDHQFPKASTPSIPKYDENICYCWDIYCTIYIICSNIRNSNNDSALYIKFY